MLPLPARHGGCRDLPCVRVVDGLPSVRRLPSRREVSNREIVMPQIGGYAPLSGLRRAGCLAPDENPAEVSGWRT